MEFVKPFHKHFKPYHEVPVLKVVRCLSKFFVITFSPFCIISRKLKINIKHLIKHCYYTAIYIIVVMDTPIAYCHDLLFSLNYF